MKFSELFNLLLDHVVKPDGRKYMLIEIAEATGISDKQLGLYKRHEKNNPTLDTIQAIFNFFNVPMAFLDAHTPQEALDIIKAAQQLEASNMSHEPVDPQLRFRSPQGMDLSPRALNQVQEIVSWVIHREQALTKGEAEPPFPRFEPEEPDDTP